MAKVCYECLAKDPWVVVIAYIMAFLPWTILSSYDFVNTNWRSVKSTRRNGWLHLTFSAIPLIYIIFYVVIQGLAKEYSEMCAAIVASFFAAWNVIRAAWGLWQLHIFRTWVEKSVQYLNAVGIDCKLRKKGVGSQYGSNDSNDLDASMIADEIYVNEEVIDNQVSHGKVLCLLKYKEQTLLNWGLENSEDHEELDLSSIGRFIRQYMFSLCAMFLIIKDFLSALFVKNYHWNVRMEPVKPVVVSVTWMATFAVQLLDHMVTEIKISSRVGSEDSKSGKRGDLFCSELVASAIIQLQSTIEGSSDRNMFLWKDALEWYHSSYGKFSRAELFDKAISKTEILPFKTSHKKSLVRDKLASIEAVHNLNDFERDGLSAEDTESLSEAITPKGFIEAFSALEYNVYEAHLKEFISDLPFTWTSRFAHHKDSIDHQVIEWMVILISIGFDLSNYRILSDGTTVEKNLSNSGSEPDRAVKKSIDQIDSDCIGALKNLQLQLNNSPKKALESQAITSGKSNFIREEDKDRHTEAEKLHIIDNLSPLPIWKNSLRVLSSTNRLITRAGVLIDTWLALVGGESAELLLNINESWKSRCCSAQYKISPAVEDINRKEIVSTFDVHREFEKSRLRVRMVNSDHKFNMDDQYATFMGYRMEFVRSSLAQVLTSNEEEIFQTADIQSDSTYCAEVTLPSAFSKQIFSNINQQSVNTRGLKVHLIDTIHNKIEEIVSIEVGFPLSRSEDKKQEEMSRKELETLLIALFILSFPSISVNVNVSTQVKSPNEVKSKPLFHHQDGRLCIEFSDSVKQTTASSLENSSEAEHQNNLTVIILEVVPIAAPQAMEIVVEIKPTNDNETLSIVKVKGDEVFHWNTWKDAFQGRLQGFKDWQDELKIKSLKLFPQVPQGNCENQITHRNDSIVWREWVPFRPSFCLFELTQNDALLQVDEHGYSKTILKDGPIEHIVAPLISLKENAVHYQDAQHYTLQLSSMLIEDSLTQTARVSQEEMVRLGQGNPNKYLSLLGKVKDESLLLEIYKALVLDGRKRTSRDDEIETLLSEILSSMGDVEMHNSLEVYIQSLEMLLSSNFDQVGHTRTSVELDENIHRYNILQKISDIMDEYIVSCSSFPMDGCFRLMQRIFLHTREVGNSREIIRLLFKTFFLTDVANMRAIVLESILVTVQMLEYRKVKWGYIVEQSIKNEILEIQSMVSLLQYSDLVRRGVNWNEEELKMMGKLSKYCSLTKNTFNMNTGNYYSERGCQSIITEYCTSFGGLLRSLATNLAGFETYRDVNNIASKSPTLITHEQEGGKSTHPRLELIKRFYKNAYAIFQNQHAYNSLLILYRFGTKDFEPCLLKAKECLEDLLITDDRDSVAMFNLAIIMNDGGYGVEIDAPRAVQLYRRVIELDDRHIDAMRKLAHLLTEGAEGVEPDKSKAVKLYEEALQRTNNTDCMVNLAYLLMDGTNNIHPDASRALKLYEEAIEVDQNIDAMYNLAVLLINGAENVEKDTHKAVQILENTIKVDGKHVRALVSLAHLLHFGTGGLSRN